MASDQPVNKPNDGHRHEQSIFGPYCVNCHQDLKPPYTYWQNGQPNAPEGWKKYRIIREIDEESIVFAPSFEAAVNRGWNFYTGNGRVKKVFVDRA